MPRPDRFRRRLASVAFLLAIGLLARDSCEKDQRTRTTVELDFGGAQPRVRAVNVDVVADGDAPLARFHRAALPGAGIGPCRFALALPGGDGELQIDVDLGGVHRRLIRRFHPVEGATTRVTLTERDLAVDR